MIYSLLATCKKHNVNPQRWLSDVPARIPSHPHKQIDNLLPITGKHARDRSPGGCGALHHLSQRVGCEQRPDRLGAAGPQYSPLVTELTIAPYAGWRLRRKA